MRTFFVLFMLVALVSMTLAQSGAPTTMSPDTTTKVCKKPGDMCMMDGDCCSKKCKGKMGMKKCKKMSSEGSG